MAISDPVNWAKTRLAKKRSLSTVAEYHRVWDRLSKKWPGLGDNGRTRAVERAAVRYFIAQKIQEVSDNPVVVAKLWKMVERLDFESNAAKSAYKNGEIPDNRQKKHTKRRSLRGLPPDWRQLLVAAAAGSRYGKAIQIMSVCGCRPSEMVGGVTVRREGDELVMRIAGVKVSELTNGGQSWREVRIAGDHPLAVSLVGGVYAVPTARAIENAVEHFGRKLWPGRAELISAYSLRHAAAGDFKDAGLPAIQVAAALGHQSTATMGRYGSANKRGGGLVLVGATAEKSVREPAKGAKAKPIRRAKPVKIKDMGMGA